MNQSTRGQSVIEFGKRLRAIREMANVSQEQIHYATGITQMHISKIESGQINTSIEIVSKLAAFFGLRDFELFKYDEPIPSAEFLQKNISKFLNKSDINPEVFLKKGLTYMLKKEITFSKMLNVPRFAIEIKAYLEDKYHVKFSTSRISDVMEEFRKKGIVEVITTDKKTKLQYRKR